jgi:DNA polymerase I-like protein with 3'-5' exonuclease and polymerase domains
MTKDYYIIKTKQQANDAFEYLSKHKGYLAVDTETTNTDPFKCELLGISFSIKEGEAFYLPNGLFTWEFLLSKGGKYLKTILSRNKLIMYNSVFDLLVLKYTLGIDCRDNLYSDSILQKHTLDESRPHGLKETAMKYLGPEWGDDREDLKQSVLANGGKWTKAEKNFDKADLDILGKYACADADMTLRLFNLFEQKLIDQNLHDFFYKDEVMPLNKVVLNMTERGIKVDVPYYTQLKEQLKDEEAELEKNIHTELKTSYPEIYTEQSISLIEDKIPIKATGSLFEQMFIEEGLPIVFNKNTGKPTFNAAVIKDALKDNPGNRLLEWRLGLLTTEDYLKTDKDKVDSAREALYLKAEQSPYVINLGSNDQLGDLLFNRLGEECTEKTEGGKPQVNDDVLEPLAKKYKFVELLLQLKKIRKLLSVYVEAALEKNVDGITRPGWLQFGTDSGRFSCVNPNYMNLPRNDKRIKQGIVAREGMVLVGADYAQLEARCFAHCSNEQKLIDAFKAGKDFYGTLAVDLFDLDCDANEVNEKYPDIRFKSKVVGLAVTYGAKKWRISSILDISVPEADKFRDNYFKKYSNLAKYIRQCQGKVLLHGFIANETGRVRHLPDLKKLKGKKDKKSVREFNGMLNLSVNFPVQSLAASIVNRAMIQMTKRFREEEIDAHIVLQIHDEIVAEVDAKNALKCHKIMKNVMEQNYKLKVPLITDPKIGNNLAQCK